MSYYENSVFNPNSPNYQGSIPNSNSDGDFLFDLDLQLFAKKNDIRQIESVAKDLNMTMEQRRGFGDYVESLKEFRPNNFNFTYKELLEIGKEYLEW